MPKRYGLLSVGKRTGLRLSRYPRKKRRVIRSYAKSSNVTIPRSLWPNRRIATLTYAENRTLDPLASGNIIAHTFAANGLFDPDITSGGHQPLGFDQLSPFYAKMTVLKSTITCTFSPSSSIAVGYMLGIQRNVTASALATQFTSIQENGNAVMRPYVFNGMFGNCPKVRINFDTKKHMSVKDPLDEPNLASTAAANPTRTAFFDVFAQPLDTGTDLPLINVNVVIQYTVICTDPIPAPSS